MSSPSPLRRSPRKRKSISYAQQAPGSNSNRVHGSNNTKRRVVAELQTHCEEGKYWSVLHPRPSPFKTPSQPSNEQQQHQQQQQQHQQQTEQSMMPSSSAATSITMMTIKEDVRMVEVLTKEDTANNDDNDDELFRPIPPKDDCPICALPLPIAGEERTYMTCCGKLICTGCYEENIRVTRERRLIPSCAFCREPTPTSYDENVTRIKKRMEVNDSEAIFVASHCYKDGKYGLPTDPKKALDLCLRAADLGHSVACHNVARLYEDGVDVAKDMTEARKYNKMAVKKGHTKARINLGVDEWNNGNYRVASRHWLLSAGAGHTNSMKNIAELYRGEVVTKEECFTALTSYKNVHKKGMEH